jgi:hypothetical protein
MSSPMECACVDSLDRAAFGKICIGIVHGSDLHLPLKRGQRSGGGDEGLARKRGVRVGFPRQGQDDRHSARRGLGKDALPRGPGGASVGVALHDDLDADRHAFDR